SGRATSAPCRRRAYRRADGQRAVRRRARLHRDDGRVRAGPAGGPNRLASALGGAGGGTSFGHRGQVRRRRRDGDLQRLGADRRPRAAGDPSRRGHHRQGGARRPPHGGRGGGGAGGGRPSREVGQRQRAGQRHQPGGAPAGGGRRRTGGHERRGAPACGGLAGGGRLFGRDGHPAPQRVRTAGHGISIGSTRRNTRVVASYCQMGGPWNFRRLVVAVVAAALPLASNVPVHAADAVNQKQTIDTGANTLRTPMAQTFKAGASGQVDRISLEQTFPALTENVQLQGVTNGKPDGTVLGSSSFTGALGCCRLWKDFIFNPTVPVTAGTAYAIVVAPSSNLTWYDSYA